MGTCCSTLSAGSYESTTSLFRWWRSCKCWERTLFTDTRVFWNSLTVVWEAWQVRIINGGLLNRGSISPTHQHLFFALRWVFLRHVAVLVVSWMSSCFRFHLRQCLRETATISCDFFTLVSEWEFLPGIIIGLLTIEINYVFLTRCASYRSIRLLGEHGVILVLELTSALLQHFQNVSDLLAQLGELSQSLLLIGKLSHELMNGLFQLVHDINFKVQKISFICLERHLLIEVAEMLVCLISMLLKFRSELGHFVDQWLKVGVATNLHILDSLRKFSYEFPLVVNLIFCNIHSISEHLKIVNCWELEIVNPISDPDNVPLHFDNSIWVTMDLFCDDA